MSCGRERMISTNPNRNYAHKNTKSTHAGTHAYTCTWMLAFVSKSIAHNLDSPFFPSPREAHGAVGGALAERSREHDAHWGKGKGRGKPRGKAGKGDGCALCGSKMHWKIDDSLQNENIQKGTYFGFYF